MKFVPLHSIETHRLILRPLRRTDLEAYHRHLADPEVTKYMLGQPSPDMAHTRATIERRMASSAAGDSYFWAITRKGEDSLMGAIALLGFEEQNGSCSFAYMLGRAFWGQGIGTEALKAVLDFAFREMEISEISADHFAENPASGAVMAKVGMRKAGLAPRKYEKNGEFHDAVSYAITREEWQK